MKILKSLKTIKIFVLTSLTALLISCGSTSSNGQIKLDAVDFDMQIKQTANPQILDVRTPNEYSNGHIENSRNLNIYANDFNQKLDLLNKSDTIFVYCKAGGRSSDASRRLVAKGFKNVYDLNGGILKWKRAKLPVAGAKTHNVTNEFSVGVYDSVVSSQSLVIVDFHAPWCGPCKKMSPYLKKMKSNYSEDKLKIVKIDTDENPLLTQHFNISGIPLIKIYHNGELVKEKLGYVSETEMMRFLEPYLTI
jgi:thioredoxin